MGPSGCGKSTVGGLLAEMQGWPFHEGDDFHPEANVAKMASGEPLTDLDRAPWIAAIRQAVDNSEAEAVVLACSALTPFVQSELRKVAGRKQVWILLDADPDTLRARMERRDHFMPPGLLESQLSALSPPPDAIRLSVDQDPQRLVQQIADLLSAD